MSESGDARLRRYPELPVWVVEDHQEVSGQLIMLGRVAPGLRRRRSLEARENQNPSELRCCGGKQQDSEP